MCSGVVLPTLGGMDADDGHAGTEAKGSAPMDKVAISLATGLDVTAPNHLWHIQMRTGALNPADAPVFALERGPLGKTRDAPDRSLHPAATSPLGVHHLRAGRKLVQWLDTSTYTRRTPNRVLSGRPSPCCATEG